VNPKYAGMKASNLDRVLLLGGGVIPSEDVTILKEWGVSAVFGPGASAEEAIELIREQARNSEEASA